jgi:cytochrome b
MRSIKVWDFPTRVFHWALVFFVLFAYITGEGRPHGLQFTLHIVGGYAVALLIAFRVVWGFVGGEHARFPAFVHGWQAFKDHARSLLRLAPPHTLGHNPVGGWMIMLMLATLVAIVLTGLLSQGVTGGTGPLTGVLPQSLVHPVGEIHELLGSFILWLAGIHVLGVLVESVMLRENLTRAMITGTKPADLPGARDARPAPWWRAAAAAVLFVFLAGYMASVTTVPDTAPPRIHKERTAEE